MKRFTTQPTALAVCLAISLLVAPFAAGDSFAEDALAVSIGDSAWTAEEAQSHDITRNALKEGKTTFVVSASANDTYQVTLSEKQVEDILAGSTVVVNSEDGKQKVKIGPKEKKAVKSGW